MSYTQGQVDIINQMLEDLNSYVNEIIKARDDVTSILNFNDVITDNSILNTILDDAKNRGLTAAQGLVTLLEWKIMRIIIEPETDEEKDKFKTITIEYIY